MTDDTELAALIDAVVAGDAQAVSGMLARSPVLARAAMNAGASRQAATSHFIPALAHYRVAGDTALHLAAAAYRADVCRMLIAAGADVRAGNRRRAEPLHYAASGGPTSPRWNPPAQAETIAALAQAGADPNALNMDGVSPLHVAVRNRSAAAVAALLEAGADPARPNGSGSTPLRLAAMTTGKSGSGSPEAKAQQEEIQELLEQALRRRR